jgi:hypothetical protein
MPELPFFANFLPDSQKIFEKTVDKYGKMWYINYDRSKTGFSNFDILYIGDAL